MELHRDMNCKHQCHKWKTIINAWGNGNAIGQCEKCYMPLYISIELKPDSPEEKKCCEMCGSILGNECIASGCPCHKPETTHEKDSQTIVEGLDKLYSHEKDFIEEALSEFVRRFPDLREYDNALKIYSVCNFRIETFLKEKLIEAMESGRREAYDSGHHDAEKGYYAKGNKEGRLTMKEEVLETLIKRMNQLEESCNNYASAELYPVYMELKRSLAAIREMK